MPTTNNQAAQHRSHKIKNAGATGVKGRPQGGPNGRRSGMINSCLHGLDIFFFNLFRMNINCLQPSTRCRYLSLSCAGQSTENINAGATGVKGRPQGSPNGRRSEMLASGYNGESSLFCYVLNGRMSLLLCVDT